MAVFGSRPVIGSDPWGSVREAYDVSLENAINGVEADVTVLEGTVAGHGSRLTATEAKADAALPSVSFDTRLGTRVKVDNTVGRTAHVWDATNSRWQLIYGDTGWRDITSSLINGWTATRIHMKRTCYRVTIAVEGLNASAMTSTIFLTAPAGFQISSATHSKPLLFTATNPAVTHRANVQNNGELSVLGATTSLGVVSGVIEYEAVQSWPATLPGTAFGTIPNA